jgi:Transglutaminase-like superfamily
VGLVTPVDLDRLRPIPRARLVWEVLVTYLRVRWVMHDADSEHAVGRLRGKPDAAVAMQSHDNDLLAAWRLSRAVVKVLEPLPSDSRCLFRSLTLLAMLQRRNIAQKLVIAVRARPFAAHAWVEVAGQAILPQAEPGYERLLEL